MFYILARCPYYKEGRKDKDKTGIKRLLSNGTYTAAFPLHDVRHMDKNNINMQESNISEYIYWSKQQLLDAGTFYFYFITE